MSQRLRNAIFSLVLLISILVVWWIRKPSLHPIRLEGKTMGTSYHITYFDVRSRNFQDAVDSLMILVNRAISTYDTSSEISRFNRARKGLAFNLPYFFPPLKKSAEVFEASGGSYDPTVMPLVNAWGFGPRKIEKPDTAEVLAAREWVGFRKIGFDEDSVWKSDSRVQLDFSAIGQGYGADVIADFFQSKSIENFFIELGGEGVAWGKNLEENRDWEIGILDPTSDYVEQKFIANARVLSCGYSTSGNYFNYRIVDGKRYSHTLDPVSGFPVEHPLLSATVFAADCSTADSWATAFMSMGHIKAIELLKQHPELGVLLVFTTEKGLETYATENIKAIITLQNRMD